MGKKSEPTISTTKDRRLLMCALTAEEMQAASSQLADAVHTRDRVRDEKKTVVSQMNARINQLDGDINLLAQKIKDNAEQRAVECEITANYTECTIQVKRLDTCEIIDDRKMTGDEKEALPFSET